MALVNYKLWVSRSRWARVVLHFLACRECGFESRRRSECSSVVNNMCFAHRGLCDKPISLPEDYVKCV